VKPEEGNDPLRIFPGKSGFLRCQEVGGLRAFLSLTVHMGRTCWENKLNLRKKKWLKHQNIIFCTFVGLKSRRKIKQYSLEKD
jgi:hypothetical protein